MLIRVEEWELQIGPSTGAVVVYAKERLRGKELALWIGGRPENKVFAQIVERNGVYAALFPALPPGNHDVLYLKDYKESRVTVFAGHVAELDWR